MRKLTSLILLVVFLFMSDGYDIYFRYMQYTINTEIGKVIEGGVKDKDLTVIVVPLNNEREIKWIKKGKEFKYKGKMYDVAKVEIKGINKYYYCINDTKELQLLSDFAKHNNRKNDIFLKQKKPIQHKYFQKEFSLNAGFYNLLNNFPKDKDHYKSKFIDVDSPPPKFNFFI